MCWELCFIRLIIVSSVVECVFVYFMSVFKLVDVLCCASMYGYI